MNTDVRMKILKKMGRVCDGNMVKTIQDQERDRKITRRADIKARRLAVLSQMERGKLLPKKILEKAKAGFNK